MAQHTARQNETVRDVLRAQTHEAHERLHEHATFVALFKQTISPDQYRDLMRRFYGFYVPLDQAIGRAVAGLASNGSGYDYAMRAEYLRQDLADLGVSDAEIECTPTCDHLANIVTPASLGGVLYVIEGSTLGAAPIDRAAQKLLSDKVPDGRRFWAWSRAQNKQRWSMTHALLTTYEETGAPLDPLVTGARATFEALGEWLAPLDMPLPVRHEMLA